MLVHLMREAIRVHHWSTVVISGYQWSSVVISGHQWSSVVIRGVMLVHLRVVRRHHAELVDGAQYGARLEQNLGHVVVSAAGGEDQRRRT